jgi:chorismate dehydratase
VDVRPVKTDGPAPSLRIGAVSYLNSRPLVDCLAQFAPEAQVILDYPSRLADGLKAGTLDVSLIPSIEYFCQPGATVVSDACVSCQGRVQSVKLYGRVPVEKIRSLALDEGSRTSVALTRILLQERHGIAPRLERLPLGASAADTSADAVMLIGDRGLLAPEGQFAFVWDLGEEWVRWTGLPFVFAMWVARPNVATDRLARLLSSARDEGVSRLEAIARDAAPKVGLSQAACLVYLRDHLAFRLGPEQRRGLELFAEYAAKNRLVPEVPLVFHRTSA